MRGKCLAKAFAATAATLILMAIPPVFAQESLDLGPVHIDVQNAAETDWAISTAGKNNAFNNNSNAGVSCPPNGNSSAPGCGLSTNGNSWNLMAYRFDTLINGRVSSDTAERFGLDNWDFFVHGRFWSNIVPLGIDGNMPSTHEMNFAQHYPGNGWTATVAENNYELDAAEAYTDLRKGRWWLRLGKQQIVYGEELGFQTLDAVNSLDFRRHSIINFSGLEFSDARYGTNAARLTYDVGDQLSRFGIHRARITAWVAQFEPDVFLPPGSAYNASFNAYETVVPGTGPYSLYNSVGEASYGAVAEWSMLGVDFSANFYSHPERVGYFSVAGIAPNRSSGIQGLNLNDPTGYYDLLLAENMPREYIFGGMASYMIQPIYTFPGADIINGDIVRFSGTYTPNKTLAAPGYNQQGFVRMGDLNIAVDVEKDYRWTEALPSAFILAEYNYRSASSLFGDTWLFANARADHMFNLFLLSMQQPLPLARWTLVNVLETEANQNFSFFEQPGVVYKPTSAQEYDVFYNFASGTLASFEGPFQFMDEICIRAIYKF